MARECSFYHNCVTVGYGLLRLVCDSLAWKYEDVLYEIVANQSKVVLSRVFATAKSLTIRLPSADLFIRKRLTETVQFLRSRSTITDPKTSFTSAQTTAMWNHSSCTFCFSCLWLHHSDLRSGRWSVISTVVFSQMNGEVHWSFARLKLDATSQNRTGDLSLAARMFYHSVIDSTALESELYSQTSSFTQPHYSNDGKFHGFTRWINPVCRSPTKRDITIGQKFNYSLYILVFWNKPGSRM